MNWREKMQTFLLKARTEQHEKPIIRDYIGLMSAKQDGSGSVTHEAIQEAIKEILTAQPAPEGIIYYDEIDSAPEAIKEYMFNLIKAKPMDNFVFPTPRSFQNACDGLNRITEKHYTETRELTPSARTVPICSDCNDTGVIDTGFYKRQCMRCCDADGNRKR